MPPPFARLPSFPINFFQTNRSASLVRADITAKRKELSAIEEKMVGIEKARDMRKQQLERLLAELALSETPATAASRLCPA